MKIGKKKKKIQDEQLVNYQIQHAYKLDKLANHNITFKTLNYQIKVANKNSYQREIERERELHTQPEPNIFLIYASKVKTTRNKIWN